MLQNVGAVLGRLLFQWQSNMPMKSLELQKSRSVSLKIIRPPSIAMKPPVFIEFQDQSLKVISVLEKHGIALRWNNTRSYESNRY